MVYGFVKQSGGHIKIYSEPGHGTTIRLYLPPANGETDTATVAAAAVVGGSETILIVEDDALVRQFRHRATARARLQDPRCRPTAAPRLRMSTTARRSICCLPMSSCPAASAAANSPTK